jgi:hypothetical protein
LLIRERFFDAVVDLFADHRAVAGSPMPASGVIAAQRARTQAYLEALELFGRCDL